MSSPMWSRWITVATVLLLAAIAAVVSYAHMFELALGHGEPAWRAGLFPLSVDGMIVAASMSLLSDARQGRRGGVLPWTLLIRSMITPPRSPTTTEGTAVAVARADMPSGLPVVCKTISGSATEAMPLPSRLSR
ncbi:uncharacterized protein DUF2637 [Haloactinospora alba]|uniref:Uncharacterized protein DUF2637 n=1 Tax=Haloactinospora alba TaxID=405555 RepID=A0A543NK52_9ACTN|nr:DUF2637 domain-containing protein [Haloactinospora alba]TQN32186.1 uncharacterized protein DUF2637 [Haloactinospora alba]